MLLNLILRVEDADAGQLSLDALFFDELDQNCICIDYKVETISLNDFSIDEDDDNNDYFTEIFIDEVHALTTTERNNELLSNLEVNGDSILCKVDTGAQRNVCLRRSTINSAKSHPLFQQKQN